MYRRRTVESLLRHHARREEALLAIVREQNDRLMLLSGRPFSPTPLELARIAEAPDYDEPIAVEVGQMPDDLGGAW